MKQNSLITINDFKKDKELDYINSIWFAIMTMDGSVASVKQYSKIVSKSLSYAANERNTL